MSNSENSHAEQIILQCLKLDEYLKTIKKALVFDEDDVESFENTYNEILNEAIAINWRNHDVAEQISRDDFRKILRLD